MKKWFLIISSILLAILLGSGMITLHGHNERNYQVNLQRGRFDVIDRNYRDALNYFQGAQKVNPDHNQASRDLSQTQSYVNGNHYFRFHRLYLANQNYYRAVRIGAISALNRRSLKRYDWVKKLRSGSAEFVRKYGQALVLNHQRKFKTSARRLDQIKKTPIFNSKYFRKFRTKVNRLLAADHQHNRSHQVTNVVNPRSTRDSFKLKTPRIITDHPNRVTVAKARREIQRAGVNSREMSNADVINVIRQARRHHSNVTKYAKNNY